MDDVDIDTWKTEIKRGIVEMCILALLSKKEMYGYEISKTIKQLSSGFLTIEEGTLYPLLRRLEGKGYIRGEWKIVHDKARKYYKITSLGLQVFAEMRSFWKKLSSIVNNIVEVKEGE
ncbi:MAG: PadR family transcriptional regulator [Candidatus Njordarchaeales archaeon]